MPIFCSPLFSRKNPRQVQPRKEEFPLWPTGGKRPLPRLVRSLASLASIGLDEFDHFGCLCLTRQRCHEDTRFRGSDGFGMAPGDVPQRLHFGELGRLNPQNHSPVC